MCMYKYTKQKSKIEQTKLFNLNAAVISRSMNADVLSAQLIYESKTDRCHTYLKFLKIWYLSHYKTTQS